MIDRVDARGAGLPPPQLDVVAVSLGPGGFTGIRVGLAAAHGHRAGGRSAPGRRHQLRRGRGARCRNRAHPLLVALDSRRADLYVQLFGHAGMPCGEPQAVLPGGCRACDAVPRWRRCAIAGDAAEAAAAALGESRRPRIAFRHGARRARRVGGGARPGADSDTPARPLYLRPPDVTFPDAPRPRQRGADRCRRSSRCRATAAEPLAILHRACFPDDPGTPTRWRGSWPLRRLRLARLGGRRARRLHPGARSRRRMRNPVARRRAAHGAGGASAQALLRAAIAEAGRRRAAHRSCSKSPSTTSRRATLYARWVSFRSAAGRATTAAPDGLADALILRLGLYNDAGHTHT